MYDTWIEKGGKTLAERSSDTVDHILAEHEPEPLPSTIKEKVRKIVQGAKAG
jgi:trimethylamine:corrinoid methyltransferase-like protein